MIGTAPNLILFNFLNDQFGGKHKLTFGNWMIFAIPIEIICLIALWLRLQFYILPPELCKKKKKKSAELNIIPLKFSSYSQSPALQMGDENNFKKKNANIFLAKENKIDKISTIIKQNCLDLGPMTFREITILVLFIILLLLWFLRSPGFFKGYGDIEAFLDEDGNSNIAEATPAILIVIVLFVLPGDLNFLKLKPSTQPLITWHIAEKHVNWGVILLLGGGSALAKGCNVSGKF